MPNNFENHAYVMSLVKSAQDNDSDQRQELRDSMLFIHKKDGQWEPYWWGRAYCERNPTIWTWTGREQRPKKLDADIHLRPKEDGTDDAISWSVFE